jgi:hypothetical protein
MNKQTLVREIAQNLLDFDLLDLHNYNGDVTALLSDTEEKILYILRDYKILQGEVF